ncbi:nuclear transport factor 2 family protein [Streptomyces seoulensis]|uniref:Nuclear transport factor 2 family protein n=1 Tax=Streptomyces seoulensis TaxID=73044 RepID=A0A4P6U2M5_STRSO|nr:nuclear transport factor 2 family protein [Streptomyces seoulensis]QBJ94375.1 nuclear transport factor 2 family protein [Streptomyces seoulensis]
MSEKNESPADVVRALYAALGEGDIKGVLARMAPDVIIDEPNRLPYGGVHRGREAFAEAVLGGMTAHADITITGTDVFEGPAGIVGRLTGTLKARSSGEEYALTLVEVHRVEDGLVQEIDVYTKNPEGVAEFFAHAEAGAADHSG